MKKWVFLLVLCAVPLLAHRVRLAAHAEGYVPSREESESVVRDIVGRVPVPL